MRVHIVLSSALLLAPDPDRSTDPLASGTRKWGPPPPFRVLVWLTNLQRCLAWASSFYCGLTANGTFAQAAPPLPS